LRGFIASRYLGLTIMAVIIAVLPFFLPNNFYFEMAILVGINAVVVVGLNLLIGYAGQISLGHAGFFALGGYTSAILVGSYGWPPLLALLVGASGVGLIAFAVARPILRLKGHYLAMATLGLGIIISIVIANEDWLTGGPDGLYVPPMMLFGFELYGERTWYWVVGGLLLLAVWLTQNIVDSPVGRALRSVHGSEVAAQVVGVDTTHFKVLIFVISAIFASVMGTVSAHYAGFITPTTAGFFHSIELVTMVVLGGMASIYGPVVGALILTILPQLLTGFEDFEMMVFGLILMLTMIFMPKGLVPTLQGLLSRRPGKGVDVGVEEAKQ
jgi:branched-chain amino acid transport system permease protein